MNLHVYIDGVCNGNSGSGGYAYVIYDDFGDVWVKSSGSELETTAKKMQIIAIIEALKIVEKYYKDSVVIIYSLTCHHLEGCNQYEMWETLSELVKKTGATFKKLSKKDKRIQEISREAKFSIKALR